jgi:hypothetical protein
MVPDGLMNHGRLPALGPGGRRVGAILRAHPHEPLAAHQGTPAPPVDHARRVQVGALGVAGILAGVTILLSGWLWTSVPTIPVGWPIGPSSAGMGAWLFWTGIGFGGLVALLGVGLILLPEYHPALGAGMVIASSLTLLAGPLLWAFLLGIVAGVVSIVVGSPASPKLFYYTPAHVTMPAPMPAVAAPMPVSAPVAAPRPIAVPMGRFCVGCGRSVSADAEFCPWCGASQAPKTT